MQALNKKINTIFEISSKAMFNTKLKHNKRTNKQCKPVKIYVLLPLW